jgi:hypothetical protein
MDLLELKIKVYNKCIEKQKDIVESAFLAMDEAQNAANDYGPPKDRYDSFRTQLLRKRDMHAGQYQKALKDLDYLQKINPENELKTVNINSLVITDKQKFYISIGLGKIEIDNDIFFIISPVAPIYNVLLGKRMGDKLGFNGQEYVITNVI